MSSTCANVSIRPTALGKPASHWLAQWGQAALRGLDSVISARPSRGLEEMATSCERLQPGLARELRAAAARVSEG